MINCSLCPESFNGFDVLYTHYSIVHTLNIHSGFSCHQYECYRSFSNWKTFRKHLVEKHSHECHEAPRDCTFESNDAYFDAEEGTDFFDTYDHFFEEESKLNPDGSSDLNYGKNNIPEVDKPLFLHALLFLCKLYAVPDIARCHVTKLVSDTETLLNTSVSIVTNAVVDLLQKSGVQETIVSQTQSLLNGLTSPFTSLTSEYLHLKALRKLGFFIDPETFVCGRFDSFDVSESATAVFIPLRKVLKCFFELPNVLISVKNNVNKLYNEMKDGCIGNFIQAELWQEKLKLFSPDKFVLPLFLYYDDFEVGNVIA